MLAGTKLSEFGELQKLVVPAKLQCGAISSLEKKILNLVNTWLCQQASQEVVRNLLFEMATV